VLTGENGSGKSTLVELIAEACELNPQGGSGKAQYRTRDSEPRVGQYLWAERGPAYPAWSYFLLPTPCMASTPTWRRTRAAALSDST
jgi:predicted ATPase